MDRDDDPSDSEPVELDLEQQQGLRALRMDVPPPPGAEAVVLEALQRRGLLPRGRRRLWPATLPLPVAAGMMLLLAGAVFAGGFAAGRSAGSERPGAPPSAPGGAGSTVAAEGGPRFLLLLYEDAGFDRAPVQLQARRAHEYGEWARGLGPTARFVGGEELAEAGRLLEPDGTARPWRPGDALPTPGAVGGYFVVEAADLDAAEVLARGCPHLAHGGRIEVRPVVRREAAP